MLAACVFIIMGPKMQWIVFFLLKRRRRKKNAQHSDEMIMVQNAFNVQYTIYNIRKQFHWTLIKCVYYASYKQTIWLSEPICYHVCVIYMALSQLDVQANQLTAQAINIPTSEIASQTDSTWPLCFNANAFIKQICNNNNNNWQLANVKW